jgi:hypothetical protein
LNWQLVTFKPCGFTVAFKTALVWPMELVAKVATVGATLTVPLSVFEVTGLLSVSLPVAVADQLKVEVADTVQVNICDAPAARVVPPVVLHPLEHGAPETETLLSVLLPLLVSVTDKVTDAPGAAVVGVLALVARLAEELSTYWSTAVDVGLCAKLVLPTYCAVIMSGLDRPAAAKLDVVHVAIPEPLRTPSVAPVQVIALPLS